MNQEQTLSLIRSIIKALGGGMVVKGYVDQSGLETIVSAIVIIIGCVLSHYKHTEPNQKPGGNGGVSLLWLLAFVPFIVGCTSLVEGRIISIQQKGFGIHVTAYNTASQSPEVQLGFFSSAITIIPTGTGTNAPSAPRFMTCMDLNQGLNPFDMGIKDTLGSGDVYVGGTNDISKAIVPTPFMLSPTNR